MFDHTLPLFSPQPETREISLTQDKVAIVDAVDYEWLIQWKWYAQKNQSGGYYAYRRAQKPNGHKTILAMHREILGITDPDTDVDHRDGHGLNNTRGNLRVATSQQNNCNKGPGIRNTTGYKGVSWSQYMRKFKAGIEAEGKVRHLGYFFTAIEAAHAYDCAASELHGEFAYLNLPPNTNVLELIDYAERDARSAGRYRFLSKEEIWQIRELYLSNSTLPYAVAAEKFNVGKSTVLAIVKGKTHINLPNRDGTAFEPIRHNDKRWHLATRAKNL